MGDGTVCGKPTNESGEMGQPRFVFLSLETGSGTGDRKKVQGLAQT